MKPDEKVPPADISIIIPTLNEAHSIGATLDAVSRLHGPVEVIVVDGGSLDETVEIALARGARVIKSERGRGPQMHAGACAARCAALWFLHADTIPPADAIEQIAEALSQRDIVGGNFAVLFDGPQRSARFLTWLYPHLRKIGLYYGDSAIFVRREAYEQNGGFQPFAIFEDLDLIRKLRRRGRMVQLPGRVVTSSRRFEGRSFALTFVRWSLLQGLYWLGVPPCLLNRHYAPIRSKRPSTEPARRTPQGGE